MATYRFQNAVDWSVTYRKCCVLLNSQDFSLSFPQKYKETMKIKTFLFQFLKISNLCINEYGNNNCVIKSVIIINETLNNDELV